MLDALDELPRGAEVTVDTGLSYLPGEPVRVRIRHRDHHYDIDDDGTAVRLAGKPSGWFDRTVRKPLVVDQQPLGTVRAVLRDS